MSDRVQAAVAELVAALRAEMAAPASAPPELLDVSEAARRAGIGRSLMYDLIGRGSVRSVKIGRLRRIPADAIAALATNEAVPAVNRDGLEVTSAGSTTPRR